MPMSRHSPSASLSPSTTNPLLYLGICVSWTFPMNGITHCVALRV